MLKYDISFPKLIEGYEKYKDILKLIESEENIEKRACNNYIVSNDPDEKLFDPIYWYQVGAVRTLMDLIDETYFKSRSSNPYSHIIEKYRTV